MVRPGGTGLSPAWGVVALASGGGAVASAVGGAVVGHPVAGLVVASCVLIAPWLLAGVLVTAAFVVAVRGRRGRRGIVAGEGTVEVIDALRRLVDSVLGR
ncbi:hypothetical protein [Micromonospora carbonacea]|uniref:Uncharacterized protein n=1 Tax=Micromonospora carbonacea TaxID=47853 RepID=A0A1C5AYA2_9ACTN|nr:hypothetical protein [Micromonospora carbonacea]SCF50041.1 hypothetical protein GA0070563_12618 [Micromonospora carbonacea]